MDAVTTDNVILAGFAAQPQYAGKLKVVGKPFSEERYGVGLKKGDTELCGKVNAALEKMVADGSWQQAVDGNVGPSGFKVDTANHPSRTPVERSICALSCRPFNKARAPPANLW